MSVTDIFKIKLISIRVFLISNSILDYVNVNIEKDCGEKTLL